MLKDKVRKLMIKFFEKLKFKLEMNLFDLVMR